MTNQIRVGGPVARARMIGPFRLSASDERDLTPRGSKQIAVLALLLMAPRGQRSREYLMDKLWSDRQPEQAANSLKSALHEIRKALQPHDAILVTQGNMVGLKPGAVVKDIDSPEFVQSDDQEFLEGLAVRDPEFVDWLRDQRISIERSIIKPVRPVIRLKQQQDGDTIHADLINAGVSQGLADWCAMQIVTADGVEPRLADLDIAELSHFVLDTRTVSGNGGLALRMRLTHERSGYELWSHADVIEDDAARLIDDLSVHRIINQGIDRTLFNLGAPASAESRFLERGVLGAVRLILRNEADDLERARAHLDWNHETQPSGLCLAWSAYILAYLRAERNQAPEDLREEAEELASKALEFNPHCAMTLALCSYVYTYLLGRPAVGLILADRSIQANRANPLAWCFRCAALYTMVEYEQAFICAERARAIAGDGPYRYVVETYYCIAAMLANRVEEAIGAGEIASLLKPGFRAPLRCLSLLYAHRGDEERLLHTLAHLRRVEPDYSLRRLLEDGNYPSQVLRKAELARFADL